MPGYTLHRLLARLEMEKSLGVEYLSLPEGVEQLIGRLRTATPAQKTAQKTEQNPVRSSAVKAAAAEADTREVKVAKAAAWPAKNTEVKPPAGAGDVKEKAAEPPAGTAAVRPAPRQDLTLPPGYVSLVPYREPPPRPDREALLADLRRECLSCEKCVLCRRRTRVAWGEGDLAAEVMFIGEGPGRDEDLEGRPFVGRSGRLLTDIIEKGMKILRPEVYITNVVKCRPPGNRDPKPEETAACRVYLDRQIEVISPRILVAVGSVATRTLLNLPPDASRLRGRWYEYRGLPLLSIYHPSYLLRQRRHDGDRTEADRLTWQDVQAVLTKLAEKK